MAESQQLVDLVVVGHSSDKSVETLVGDILTLLNDYSAHLEFKLSDALLFNNGMVSIRDNISTAEAESISQKLATLGVTCELRPTLQIVPKDAEEEQAEPSSYTCPACGHEQAKLKENHNGRLDTCEVCGIIGERYQKKQHLKQVMQTESQKHENDRTKRIREVLEKAKLDEEALLREEARQRLGISEKSEKIGLKIAAAISALSIGLGGLYHYNQSNSEERPQQAEVVDKETKAESNKTPTIAINTALEKAKAIANKQRNMPADPFAEQDITSATSEISEERQAQITFAEQDITSATSEISEERQIQITEALKTDTQRPETPAEATEKKVKTDLSRTAIVEMEGQQLTPTRFQISLDEHAENRRRIQQLLKLDEIELTNTIIERTPEAYPRTLLLLDIVEWQIQHQQLANARKNIAHIEQELTKTNDITQQALILGAISKTHLLMDEWEPAGQSLQQALTKAAALPRPVDQVTLLARLANEQALFGNQIASRQVLESATKVSAMLPEGVEPRSTSFVQIASGYAMLTDFAEANKLLSSVEDPNKRQKLAEFIDKLQHRVEQVRAEYLQTAQTQQP
jgi:hypothetical protein